VVEVICQSREPFHPLYSPGGMSPSRLQCRVLVGLQGRVLVGLQVAILLVLYIESPN
jgi:hypothetical protein